MKNSKFYALLRELRTGDTPPRSYTVGVLAAAIGSNRDHVNRVLNNHPAGKGQVFGNLGARTRVKIARHFTAFFPERAGLLLASLGWDGEGNIVEQTSNVPRGNRDVS